MKKSTVTLDTAVFSDSRENDNKFFKYLRDHKIAYEVINAEGPAGGHPVIKYSGSTDNLVAFVEKFFGAELVYLINVNI